MIDPATFPEAPDWVGTSGLPLDLFPLADGILLLLRKYGQHPARVVLHPKQAAELDEPWTLIETDDRVPVVNGGHDYCGALIGDGGTVVAICSKVPRTVGAEAYDDAEWNKP